MRSSSAEPNSSREPPARAAAAPEGAPPVSVRPPLRLVRADKPVVALGLSVSYLMTKPAFAKLRFGDWSRILVGQINRGHYRLVIEAKDEVQGFMGWAFTSREKAEQWVQGRHALGHDESVGGDCVILNAWAANSAEVNRFMRVEGRKMLATYGVKTIFAKRYYPDGTVRPLRLAVSDFVGRP
jgi:hemolysin-activating ACP:hemolysin acyltransferase